MADVTKRPPCLSYNVEIADVTKRLTVCHTIPYNVEIVGDGRCNQETPQFAIQFKTMWRLLEMADVTKIPPVCHTIPYNVEIVGDGRCNQDTPSLPYNSKQCGDCWRWQM